MSSDYVGPGLAQRPPPDATASAIADLRYFAGLRALDEDQLRRDSVLLRRLLVYGGLKAAWDDVMGASGRPLRLRATDLQAHLGTIDRRLVYAAWAPICHHIEPLLGPLSYTSPGLVPSEDDLGGTVVLGNLPPENGAIVLVTPPSLEDGGAVGQRQLQRLKPRPTTAYRGPQRLLKSTAYLIRGQTLSREDIICYVANKAHGAHSDDRRDGKNERFNALDAEHGSWRTRNGGDLPMVYVELASIALSVARSPDVCDLIAAAS